MDEEKQSANISSNTSSAKIEYTDGEYLYVLNEVQKIYNEQVQKNSSCAFDESILAATVYMIIQGNRNISLEKITAIIKDGLPYREEAENESVEISDIISPSTLQPVAAPQVLLPQPIVAVTNINLSEAEQIKLALALSSLEQEDIELTTTLSLSLNSSNMFISSNTVAREHQDDYKIFSVNEDTELAIALSASLVLGNQHSEDLSRTIELITENNGVQLAGLDGYN